MPILCLDAAAQIVKNELNSPTYTIVLDAGHGGKDSGCLGLYAQEKDVALAITLAVGQALAPRHDIDIIYTRSADYFVPLYERTEIANRNNADLFVSIHCNGSTNSTVYGSETFVMGLHTSQENLEVAKRENRSINLESSNTVYDGYDPDSPLGHILLAREQQQHLEQSLTLASKIETSLSNTIRKSRGVKQAGFVVLRATTMPSVLIEAGFLTNPIDEETLTDPINQISIAEDIADAISQMLVPEPIVLVEKITIRPQATAQKIVTVDHRKQVIQSPQAYYSVLITTTDVPPTEDQLSQWEIYPHLRITSSMGTYQVAVGRFVDRKLATRYQDRLIKDGLSGATVITTFSKTQ